MATTNKTDDLAIPAFLKRDKVARSVDTPLTNIAPSGGRKAKVLPDQSKKAAPAPKPRTVMKKAKPAAKNGKVKHIVKNGKPVAKAKPVAKTARTSALEDSMKIKVLKKREPREGSNAAKEVAAFSKGTVGAYCKALNDRAWGLRALSWHIRQGFISVS